MTNNAAKKDSLMDKFKQFAKTKKIALLTFAFGVAILGVNGAMGFPYRDPEGARDTLEKTTDLKDIKILKQRAWTGCGTGDMWKTKFEALNDKGQKVEGTVCKGPFKGATVRYN
ncbi:MAG: hypothetical protein ACAH83_00760 [Alphaproteobacteria bacterium]